ncbi:MAG TPA: hypothetical protein VHX43_18385 [Xanthobacteraceae bacterium]|jgi:hypothetical protein|nr:hypothetical protein [Xanthobacteraceae bacterium]
MVQRTRAPGRLPADVADFFFPDSGYPAAGSEWAEAEFVKVMRTIDGWITGCADRARRRKASVEQFMRHRLPVVLD